MLSIRDQQIHYLRRLLDHLSDPREEKNEEVEQELRHFSQFWMREMMRRHHPHQPDDDEEKILSYYTLGWFLYEMVGVSSTQEGR
jgi:hypothetical protein